MVCSFVHVALCRLLQPAVLFGRSERSKELEILLLRHELAILPPSAAASAAPASRSDTFHNWSEFTRARISDSPR